MTDEKMRDFWVVVLLLERLAISLRLPRVFRQNGVLWCLSPKGPVGLNITDTMRL